MVIDLLYSGEGLLKKKEKKKVFCTYLYLTQ